MKIGTIQSLACVGLGAVARCLAATRDFAPSSRADVAHDGRSVAAAETSTEQRG